MEGVRNGVREEDPGWDLKLKAGHHEGKRTIRNCARRKGVKGLWLMGHEEVPLGFG